MIQPRNSFVVVKLRLKPEERRGDIIIPTGQDEYAECEVVAVGPGSISAAGGRSETHDLQPGQRVLARHKRKQTRINGAGLPEHRFAENGLKLKPSEGEDLYLFEETDILAIVAQ